MPTIKGDYFFGSGDESPEPRVPLWNKRLCAVCGKLYPRAATGLPVAHYRRDPESGDRARCPGGSRIHKKQVSVK